MNNTYKTSDAIFAELFVDVQMKEVFEDSKTFADAIPLSDPTEILKKYRAERNSDDFRLQDFVSAHFSIPENKSTFQSDKNLSVSQHIEKLWDKLKRDADKNVEGSSLFPLPKPYIVPGGRFFEIFYWDSFFTMQGLAKSGRTDLIESMIDNFCHLIDLLGFIPNGNRTYFQTRSQPPFFALMVKLLADLKKEEGVLQHYLPWLEKEYTFWMRGKEKINEPFAAEEHVVQLEEGVYLNRYYDFSNTPRQESYKEDVELAEGLKEEDQKRLYKNLKAACESGWDFSCRWLRDSKDLASMYILDMVPVDLNCLLWELEETLSLACEPTDAVKSKNYKNLANARKQAIQSYCWNANLQTYYDFDFKKKRVTGFDSLAMAFPLYHKIASVEQAEMVKNKLESQFLGAGGWLTTLCESGQQWDYPNGWAPLQWMVVEGLKNYGYQALAEESKSRWLQLNEKIFKEEGKMLEKYNVADPDASVGGGEYPVQDGFGWTNGVYLGWKPEK